MTALFVCDDLIVLISWVCICFITCMYRSTSLASKSILCSRRPHLWNLSFLHMEEEEDRRRKKLPRLAVTHVAKREEGRVEIF